MAKALRRAAPGFEKIPFDDLDALEKRLSQRRDQVAAFLVEPIQAEGGVMVPDPGYLPQASQLCRRQGALLVIDEIQTGLGRTGRLFALPDGLVPDVLLLSKTLGGGLAPLSVCLATDSAWSHEFGYLHSSTFANNGLARRGSGDDASGKVLEIEWSDDLAALQTADAVVVATNSPNEVVTAGHLAPEALVCDLATPSNVSPEVETLPLHHRDPFDRLLIAQAIQENFSVLSADASFDAYGVKRIWT